MTCVHPFVIFQRDPIVEIMFFFTQTMHTTRGARLSMIIGDGLSARESFGQLLKYVGVKVTNASRTPSVGRGVKDYPYSLLQHSTLDLRLIAVTVKITSCRQQ